jgi:TRAP-type C4-dicarboxylate transport system permease small subunit
MRSVLDIVFKVLGALAAFFILATLTIEVVGIALRMVGFSMAGSDAYAGYFLAAGSFLALGYALREGDHIRVTLILQRLRGRTRWWMEVLCLVIASALSVYFAYFAARLVWGSYAFNDISQNVDATPLWIPQLSMAIGLAGLALAFIEQLVITLRTRRLPPAVNEAAHIE